MPVGRFKRSGLAAGIAKSNGVCGSLSTLLNTDLFQDFNMFCKHSRWTVLVAKQLQQML